MSRQVFIRSYGEFAQYNTTETLSPNTWTYVLMSKNQPYISVNGLMQLIRNRPQTQLFDVSKQTLKRSKSNTNLTAFNGTKQGALCHKGLKPTNL
jgi:hypothetical protein